MVLYIRFFTTASIPGFASLAILILFIGGVQLLAVGLLGEYVSRIFDEVKQRPLYVTRTLVGWETASPALPSNAEESVEVAKR